MSIPTPDTTVHTDTPAHFSRDPDSGLVNNVVYIRDAQGRIDWKAMINPAHIVFQGRKNEKLAAEIAGKYGATYDKLVYAEVVKTQPVEDKHVLILLAGFIELADLRGYNSSHSHIAHVTPGGNVTCVSHIEWLPNVEEPYPKTSSGEADATVENTGGFGYLAALAGNRAFVRAVRRGLRIPILGADEIAAKDADSAPAEGGASSSGSAAAVGNLSPQGILQKTASELGVTFEQVKAGATTKHKAKIEVDATAWTGFGDVPPRDCMTLINLLRDKKSGKGKSGEGKPADGKPTEVKAAA